MNIINRIYLADFGGQIYSLKLMVHVDEKGRIVGFSKGSVSQNDYGKVTCTY